jgi:hypothetical protein
LSIKIGEGSLSVLSLLLVVQSLSFGGSIIDEFFLIIEIFLSIFKCIKLTLFFTIMGFKILLGFLLGCLVITSVSFTLSFLKSGLFSFPLLLGLLGFVESIFESSKFTLSLFEFFFQSTSEYLISLLLESHELSLEEMEVLLHLLHFLELDVGSVLSGSDSLDELSNIFFIRVSSKCLLGLGKSKVGLIGSLLGLSDLLNKTLLGWLLAFSWLTIENAFGFVNNSLFSAISLL